MRFIVCYCGKSVSFSYRHAYARCDKSNDMAVPISYFLTHSFKLLYVYKTKEYTFGFL